MNISFFSRQTALRIGTRASPLALAQAYETQALLSHIYGIGKDAFEIVKIQTTGDRFTAQKLSEIGGKGLFVKEIEEKLLAGSIDIAVHSLKDMPIEQPEGLTLGPILEREDPRDGLIVRSDAYKTLSDLPYGALAASSSTRRVAQLRNVRPDIKIISLRGNVGTRIKKIAEGHADFTFLAMAGLKRLKLEKTNVFATIPAPRALEYDVMLPAPAQGAISIEYCTKNTEIKELLEPLNHPETAVAITAERAFLKALDGSCSTPIAALARVKGKKVTIIGEILSPDGAHKARATLQGECDVAHIIGTKLAKELLTKNIPFHN